MFRHPIREIVATSALLTFIIPLQLLLRALFRGWPLEQILVLRSFITSSSSVRACLTMANDEMRTILDLDVVLFDEHKHKFWSFFAEQDGWVGESKNSVVRAMGQDLHSIRVVHGKYGIPHAFSICT